MGKIDLNDLAQKLKFETMYMSSEPVVDMPNSNFNRPGLQLAGYFEFYADKRAQIIGMSEMSYIDKLPEDERISRVDEYFRHGMPFLVISRNLDIPEFIIDIAKKYDITLFRSERATSELLQVLISYLDNRLLPTVTVHGVMLDIFGQGVLILGQSGVGKSETALELLQRGSRLVADDGVKIQRKRSDRLLAQAPELIKYFMEIRGVGIIDVKAMFGVGSVVDKKEIDMVVKLENWDPDKTYERLGMEREYYEILGVNVPLVTIPVRPGRNMASVLEVAARNERLKDMGYCAAQELNDRILNSNSKKRK